ncbi:helix-turn-helix domain-containing protein [Erythrobacter cryptus]|uniref:helix-turn-helix domain-containing protein n=1 Tax=Erythrobacter cryptus TaxID=196588 RepID=UPI0003FD834C|nr:helix-turn-helix domain-containing protein [Erythrobacter cryptus]
MDSKHEKGAPDVPDSAVEDIAPGAGGPGAQLRAAREAQGLALAHIAAETRIPLRHLEAIERGAFDTLPSRTYAIGFARSYAKTVGLEEAAIIAAVRAELSDGAAPRSVPSAGLEPGDPARVPSPGLAWAGALAALLLAVGAYAFYNSHFAAGSVPGSLLPSAPKPSPAAPARAAPSPVAAASSGPVVLTALEDGIWVRLYEEGGARLAERTLAKGETLTVPAEARDPRLNTGRPDALAITIGGQPAAPLSDRPVTLAGVPVSAAALRARAAPTAPPTTPAAAAPTTAPAAAPPRSEARAPARRAPSAGEAAPSASAPEAAAPPASEPADGARSEAPGA